MSACQSAARPAGARWNALCVPRRYFHHGSPTMLDGTTTRFTHVKDGQTPWRGEGLRDFFLYRDLGIEQATAGRVLAQLVKAHEAPEKGTGWHRHEADFHIVIMLKGWARFMYGEQETLVEAGDCVHQKPGIVHYLFDYSPDMEYLEIVGPSDFKTIDVDAPCPVPDPKPWAA
jgi:quercetin dioxygenase-like cupin family protein